MIYMPLKSTDLPFVKQRELEIKALHDADNSVAGIRASPERLYDGHLETGDGAGGCTQRYVAQRSVR